IMRDPQNSNLFEYEHNTTWYKIQTPYSGNLVFTITPLNPTDDYDFLLYKYTDQYFCNRVATKKAKPLLSNLSLPDSTKKGVIGASEKGTKINIPKSSTESHTASVLAAKGDVFYLVLDNVTPSGKGHSVKYSIHVDFIKPKIKFTDTKDRRPVPADILLVEKNSGNRPLMNNKNFRGGEIRLVPNFGYTLYVKKDGYFSYYEDFNSIKYLEDTLINIPMVRIEKGATFDVPNIYFDEGFSQLLPVSDTSLLNFVQMFNNHPEINFEVKGYVQSYGFDVEKDMKISLDRAISVMQFFVEHGIEPERMSAKGMTKKEVQVMSNEILNKNKAFTDKKIELIIKSIDPSKKL
ncbi:OmpA family protein, partial [Bacteroidales bacterium OttesenSCG-928-C19]|nr:OmpA family protein [Bacteroidales bacterium OttesenSCG-928-C19]